MFEANEYTTGIGVVYRGSLSAKVGQKDDIARIGGFVGQRIGKRFGCARCQCCQPIECVSGGQDHPHLMPGVGQGMTKRVHSTGCVGLVAGIGGEQYA